MLIWNGFNNLQCLIVWQRIRVEKGYTDLKAENEVLRRHEVV